MTDSKTTETLVQRAKRWADEDPDPDTKAELEALLASPDLAKTDLRDRFAGALEFGTAGLRGVLGAGPNRMNRAVVLRTAFGLAKHVKAAVPDAATRGIVIGYDGRRKSRAFAEDSACVFAAAGIRALLFVSVEPTPVTSFAVKELGAAAGVMVTASHNPPEYNGYKVYWSNSAQIIEPIDGAIAAAIATAPSADKVPRLTFQEARARGLVEDLGVPLENRYLEVVRSLRVHAPAGARSFPIVYTPMHGVGDILARRALAEAGFDHVTSVPEQQKPDGAFPTVAFPNPEEKGALDLSFALARTLGAKLVLANDPDADRLAVAVPARSTADYVQLTGNQTGILLGHYLLTEDKGTVGEKRTVLASIVSSPMLGRIANKLGVHYEETLTGFKWIANRAIELEKEGYTFVFGFEEALGYTVGSAVRDKDGISAAVLVAEMCAVLAGRGKTLLDQLYDIYREYGVYLSSQLGLTRKGAAGASEIAAIMTHLREAAPKAIGAHAVVAIKDFDTSVARASDGTTTKLTLPKSNVLVFELEGGHRIIARPSGTEPKVKFYFDVLEEVRRGEAVAQAEARANETGGALRAAFEALLPT